MSWRLRLSVEKILRLIPAVLVEGTLDDRTDESAAPIPPLQRTGAERQFVGQTVELMTLITTIFSLVGLRPAVKRGPANRLVVSGPRAANYRLGHPTHRTVPSVKGRGFEERGN